MKTIFLISPYWKEEHRWMVSSVKMAELWQRKGYRVVAACMGKEDSMQDLSPTLRLYTKKDIFLPDPWNTGIAFGFSRLAWKIVREEKPDIIVVNKVLFWTSLSLLPLRVAGKKVLLITDALVGMTWWPRSFLPRVAAFFAAWSVGWLLLLAASRVVFFHPQPSGLLTVLGIKKKSEVIPTGIDETGYKSEKSQGSNVTVTYVGRLESVKGVDDFLAALAPLKKTHKGLVLQVAGFYEPGHKLVEAYKDRVEFLGLRSDIASILSKTDIFVLPSYSEGLSNALMEAMSSSCACVATAVGGNKFLLADDAGLLFEPGDREALKTVVTMLLENPERRTQLQANSRKRIEEKFSWRTVGERYDDLFHRLFS